MLRSNPFLQLVCILFLTLIPQGAALAEIYQIQLFFGLSLPEGGSVSLQEWQTFEREELANTFEGFNVIDSVGYYQGVPERSKVVTLIIEDEQFPYVESLAKRYAEVFEQDSVMLVRTVVDEWLFITAD